MASLWVNNRTRELKITKQALQLLNRESCLMFVWTVLVSEIAGHSLLHKEVTKSVSKFLNWK
jgi:hypothetical protein